MQLVAMQMAHYSTASWCSSSFVVNVLDSHLGNPRAQTYSCCKDVVLPTNIFIILIYLAQAADAFLPHASFALKDSRCHRLSIIDLLKTKNWCLCIFTYLWS